MDKGQWLLLALLLVPGPVILLVALLRGYDITVVFHRRRPPE